MSSSIGAKFSSDTFDLDSLFDKTSSLLDKQMKFVFDADEKFRSRDRDDFSFYTQGYQKARAEEDTRRFGLSEQGAESELRRRKELMSSQEGIDTRARRQATDLANERAAFDEGLMARRDVRRAQLERGTMRLDSQLKRMGKDRDLQRALSILPRR